MPSGEGEFSRCVRHLLPRGGLLRLRELGWQLHRDRGFAVRALACDHHPVERRVAVPVPASSLNTCAALRSPVSTHSSPPCKNPSRWTSSAWTPQFSPALTLPSRGSQTTRP